jgi:hypothetical protein
MSPRIRELAANTATAINHMKEQSSQQTSTSYAEYLRQKTETSRELSDMISSFVQSGQTRAKLQRLEPRLEVVSELVKAFRLRRITAQLKPYPDTDAPARDAFPER